MEYIEFIQNKDKNKVKIREIENSISKLHIIKNIAETHSKYFSKFNIIRHQVEDFLKNESQDSINELENKIKHFTLNISDLESKVSELEIITNFPTTEIENEIQNHIHFCYNGMDIDKINLGIDKCNSLIAKLSSEKNRIQKEKETRKLEDELLERERLAKIENERLQKIERKKQLYIKIGKYTAIALGIGLALWLIIAFIIPFIMVWWWAILLIGGGIAYFISLIFKEK